MIWVVIFVAVVYMSIGFLLNLLYRVKGIVDRWDGSTWPMMLLWPIGWFVYLIRHYDFSFDSLTDWLVDTIEAEQEDDGK